MRHPVAPSLRARVLEAALARLIKPRSLAPPDVTASRRFVDGWMRLPAPLGVEVEAGRVGGVACEWLRARDAAGRVPTLLYLHGGAYAVCSPRTHRPLTGAFAKRGFGVCAPDYRLAPEHPFPAALDDALAVYRGLLEAGTDPAATVLAGDSAGGALCVSLLVAARAAGLPLPAGAALFSPWTDLAATGASLVENDARDPLFHARHVARVAGAYLGDADPRTPLASPVYADLAGLPPLLIHVGETEILRDDSVRLAERARSAGVTVRLELWESVAHGWQMLAGLLPEARRSLDEAAGFLKAAVRRAGAARTATQGGARRRGRGGAKS